jgi:replicative DNA helicase Mcm
MAADNPQIEDNKKSELVVKLKEFLHKKYYKDLVKAANEDGVAIVDMGAMDKYDPELVEYLLHWPDSFFKVAEEAVNQIDLPAQAKVRFRNHPEMISISDLRSEHIGRFICTEGIVRKSSEIRPEIVAIEYECPQCGDRIMVERSGTFIGKPLKCECGNKIKESFKQVGKKLIDTRWIVIEEPFELTEGEKPSQVTILMTEDLVAPAERRKSDAGNRLKITGVLRDVPKGKSWSVKLDFYLDSNHLEPTEIGWEKVKVTKKEEEEIRVLAKDKRIYEKLVGSLAPSLYGMTDIKEAVIMQLFGGCPIILKDTIKFRGDIHILLIGEPASGKSQLLKLVPTIMPRGRYVSGKGTTTAGLTATVSKDEQFMGGWVLEAGAMVLSNKGLLSVDEFEKMSQEDQVAMHEGMEQGTISIAKASIIATLPANTAILAGGNPKFSRFDPYMSISKQITIPDTLLSRFDLKFILKDKPNAEEDTRIVDHILNARDEDYQGARPVLDPAFVRKYIAYAKDKCKPVHTKETGRMLKQFYVESRKKAMGENAPIPITLRQFEAMMRLAEASAKVQLSPVVRKSDAQRAIKLMQASLMQLGYDPDTGTIDVDKSEGATTSKERNQIRTVLDIIDELSAKKKEVLAGEIEERAKGEGVKDAEEIIERLKREGMLFSPSPGYVQKV